MYERFGLVYYGCCEPLHNKVDIIKRIPHVRKVSMSPWVDTEKGAQRLGKDLVFSDKPNPAFLAGPTWDPEVVREDLQDTLRCLQALWHAAGVHPQGYQHGGLPAAAAVGVGRGGHARGETVGVAKQGG